MRLLLVWSLLLLAPVALAQPRVLVVGDSLSAAYGIALEDGWVALLQQRIREEGLPHKVINASVSGETTAGGLARLPELLERHTPEVVLIELGGNDGLRGQSVAKMRSRLREMLRLSAEAGARAALFEMRIPANYGPAYREAFDAAFADAAEAEGAALVPFFLADIAGEPRWFQEDGIHPAAAAQPRMLEAAWPHLRPLLRSAVEAESTAPDARLESAARTDASTEAAQRNY